VNDTRVDRHLGCAAVMEAIIALLGRNGLRAVAFWPAHAEWQGDNQFELALNTSRLVIVNGEGTIHHNSLAGRRLLEVGARARAAGVPAAIVNTGWEANGPDLLSLLDDFDLIAARDSRSAEQMRAGGANVRIVPDLSLWFARVRGSAMVAGPDVTQRKGIGVTDNVDRLKALALERLREACVGRTLSIVHGAPGLLGWARFLRMGVALSKDLHHPARTIALLRMRHRLWLQKEPDIGRFLYRLASLELLVSGRFHACTLALATETPMVTQSSNTSKIASLFHDAGLDAWRCELSLNADCVQEARTMGWTTQERENLRAYLNDASRATDVLFADLAKLAAGQ